MKNFQDWGVWIRIWSWKNHGSGLSRDVGSGSNLLAKEEEMQKGYDWEGVMVFRREYVFFL